MKLYLLRNADAVPGKKDKPGELTQKGIESLRQLSKLVSDKGLSEISEIRHGKSVPSYQTAKQFKKMAGIKAKTREVPLLEPLQDFRILADIVNLADNNLLLVGHQANLGMLASYLLTQNACTNIIKFKKSAMLCLERISDEKIDSDWHSDWQVSWMIGPNLIKSS